MGGKVRHDYKIEAWDDRHIQPIEILAEATGYFVACAAYVEAVKRWPGKVIYLRQGARVLARNPVRALKSALAV